MAVPGSDGDWYRDIVRLCKFMEGSLSYEAAQNLPYGEICALGVEANIINKDIAKKLGS